MQWYSPTEWINFKDSKLFSPSTSKLEQYLSCIYYAVLMMGFNEMGPVNLIEMLFAVLSLLLTSLINALIFSEIVMIIQTLDRKK